MRLLLFCSSLFFLLVLSGCQKEIDSLDPNAPSTGGTGGGNSGGTGSSGSGSGAGSSTSYYPLTAGSWWKYKNSLSGVTSTGTAASRTKTVNGIAYTAIVSTTGTQTDTAWVASPRPNYYITSKGMSPAGNPYDVVFHYLNDTASVGYSWRYNAGHGNGFTAYITTTVVAKGLTVTVAGKTYSDVIQTRLDLSYGLGGMVMDFGNYNYFTAKGVGIVRIRSELGMMGMTMLQTSAELIDYSIK